ncbi:MULTISPECIES: hypothetical protein [Romboutsia]|uniref:Uncharacterized protein n=1 Tax=Romboutsia ilealis TaxID=1115758 RepID=A0A1V1I305_9FIRM|nr:MULTISPECIES: hypothetical protein [Romboutsia]MCI9060777.1 hypothetical protein [Romboutsia sp.]MCI9259010.1 hypothetical protein [Romboutsia sp.]CED94595.1 Hypothetical protein CRIB_1990 [Romboutsia ilealis]
MLESSLVYIFTRTFPESLILVLSGVILLGINIDKKKIFKYGIILGIIIGIIRLLPITFGVHSVLSMIALCIILLKCARNDIVKSMVSTCLVWISLALSEGIYILIATSLLNINVERLTDNTTLQGAIITLPSLLIMFLIVLLLRYIKDNILKFKIRG